MKLRCKVFGHKMQIIREINDFDWEEECRICGDKQLWGKRIPLYNIKLYNLDTEFWARPEKK